jgi:hypothetical protein
LCQTQTSICHTPARGSPFRHGSATRYNYSENRMIRVAANDRI